MKPIFYIFFCLALFSFKTQAQLPEMVKHQREVSCRTSIFSGFIPRTYVYYTQYSKDTKKAWQHGLSVTRSLNLFKVDYNNGGMAETNISAIPMNYQYQHVYNRFLNYNLFRLKNKSINSRLWYSYGPGATISYNSASGKEQYSSITVSTTNKLIFDRITKLKTVNQSVGLGLMYTALVKYAISPRLNAGLAFEYGAYLNLNRLSTITTAISWNQDQFENASKDSKHEDNISTNLSSMPSLSLSVSYLF